MSDEKDKNLNEVHGHVIDPRGHTTAFEYLKRHVGKDQLDDMVDNARRSKDHNSTFTARVNGDDVEYRLHRREDGSIKIATKNEFL